MWHHTELASAGPRTSPLIESSRSSLFTLLQVLPVYCYASALRDERFSSRTSTRWRACSSGFWTFSSSFWASSSVFIQCLCPLPACTSRSCAISSLILISSGWVFSHIRFTLAYPLPLMTAILQFLSPHLRHSQFTRSLISLPQHHCCSCPPTVGWITHPLAGIAEIKTAQSTPIRHPPRRGAHEVGVTETHWKCYSTLLASIESAIHHDQVQAQFQDTLAVAHRQHGGGDNKSLSSLGNNSIKTSWPLHGPTPSPRGAFSSTPLS